MSIILFQLQNIYITYLTYELIEVS